MKNHHIQFIYIYIYIFFKTATDADDASSGDGTFYYSMSAHTNFEVDASSGLITLIAALDYEATQSYRYLIVLIIADVLHF